MTGSLFISGLNWLLPAAGFIAVAFLLLLWVTDPYLPPAAFVFSAHSLSWLASLPSQRAFWNRSGPQARQTRRQLLVVLSDNSMGMQIKDRGATRSRAETVRELLALQKDGWQNKLEDMFQLRRYLFDSRLQPTKDFAEMAFDGRSYGHGPFASYIAERYRGQPLAGILLLSTAMRRIWLSRTSTLPGCLPSIQS